MLFPWEEKAMNGEPMPDGLSLFDQNAYTAIRNIYAAYHDGRLSKENGSAEKKKVKHKYDQAVEDEKFRNKQAIYHIKVHKQAEQAITAVRKDPSPENALRLVDVLDGIEREWKDEE